jgi:hypothetical protein
MPFINSTTGLSQGGETTVAATTFAGASGATITITSANVPAVTAGDYIEVRDADNVNNSGLYVVDTYNAGVSIVATKQALDGTVVNPANDAVSATIRILGNDADEKNVHIDFRNKLITFLNGFGSTTILDNAGINWQTFYSWIKLEWKADNDLNKFLIPLDSVTPEQFEFINGWRIVDASESTIVTVPASNSSELLRFGGWLERDVNGFIIKKYFGWRTLGNIDGGDNAYRFFATEAAATDAVFDGPVNEAVQFFNGGITDADFDFTTSTITRSVGDFTTDFEIGDSVTVQNAQNSANDITAEVTNVTATVLTVSGTPFTADVNDAQAILASDRAAVEFTCRIRVFGKTYGQSTTTDIGVTTIDTRLYSFALGEATDNVIAALVTTNLSDLFDDIITTPVAPYDDMSIGYYAAAQTRSGFNAIGGDTPSPGDAQFGVLIDGDVSVGTENGGGTASAEQIYAYVQAKLTATTDINNGSGAAAVTVIGQLAEPLLSIASTGNTLATLGQTTNPGGAGGTGVKVDSFDSNDTNRVSFVDNDGDARTFPFVASGTLNFNANLSEDAAAVYRVYFTNDDAGTDLGRDFGTEFAQLVDDNSGADIAGSVPQQVGGSSQSFDYDYDGNLQRGTGSDGTDVPITLVAIGEGRAGYIVATGTITRAVGQSFTLVAPLERNFAA